MPFFGRDVEISFPDPEIAFIEAVRNKLTADGHEIWTSDESTSEAIWVSVKKAPEEVELEVQIVIRNDGIDDSVDDGTTRLASIGVNLYTHTDFWSDVETNNLANLIQSSIARIHNGTVTDVEIDSGYVTVENETQWNQRYLTLFVSIAGSTN